MFSFLIQLYSETERYGRRPWSISYKGFVKDLWFQPIYMGVELPAADSFVQLLQFRLVTETDLSTNVGVEKVDI